MDDKERASKLRKLNYKPDFKSFKGDQVILSSGRFIFNAKTDGLFFAANKAIGFSSAGSINFDSDGVIILNSEKAIFLGNKANEPLLKGTKTEELLTEVLADLDDLLKGLKSLVGLPEGSPYAQVNLAAANMSNKMTGYKKKLKDCKSLKNYTE